MWRWFFVLAPVVLGGCGFLAGLSGFDCAPGEDCNYYVPEELYGVWEAEAPDGAFRKFVVGGVVNNYYVEAWENCEESDCYWGRADSLASVATYDAATDTHVEGVSASWWGRAPRVEQELWPLSENQALLKTFVADEEGGFNFDVPTHEDVMLRTSKDAP